MANFTPTTSNTVTKANAGQGVFIPELWSDEVIAAYQSNLVLANLVNKMPMAGKKGDRLNIPKPTRGAANVKDAADTVTIQQTSNSEVVVVVDKHYEYSRLIEDITDVQAMDSLRRFYTEDAGYQLAKQIDTDLFTLGKSLGDGDGSDWTHSNSYYMDATTGLTAYAVDTVTSSDVFSDAGFREAIQKLDDADVPMDNRCLVIPPSAVNDIRGIDRYNSSDFVDGRGVQNGQIGTLYGIDVFVSTNCPVIETAAENSAGGALKAGLLIHKDAFVLAEQMAVRSQTQYKQEYLATLYTADTLYGTQNLRTEAGLVLVFNA